MGGGMSVMGGGKSNDGEPAVVVPSKIGPILARRFEEMKKRKGAGKLPVESTLSKKQLLKEDTEEYDSNSQSFNETSCQETKQEDKVVSTKEIQQTKEETAKQVVTAEKQSRVVPLPNLERKAEEEEKEHNKGGNVAQDNKHNDHDEQEKVIQVEAKAEPEVKTGERDDKHVHTKSVDDNDDDDDCQTQEFGKFFPGSPSFRIYCTNTEEKEEEGEKHTVGMHQKCPSADSVIESVAPESPDSGNLPVVLPVAEVRSNSKRKGNKTKRFGAVKTLFKVKSCYYPMCACTGDQRRNIIPARAAN